MRFDPTRSFPETMSCFLAIFGVILFFISIQLFPLAPLLPPALPSESSQTCSCMPLQEVSYMTIPDTNKPINWEKWTQFVQEMDKEEKKGNSVDPEEKPHQGEKEKK